MQTEMLRINPQKKDGTSGEGEGMQMDLLRIESAEKRRDIRGRGRGANGYVADKSAGKKTGHQGRGRGANGFVADRIRGKKAGHHGRIGERMCLGM